MPELKAVKQQSVAHWSSRQQREQTNCYKKLGRLNIEGGKTSGLYCQEDQLYEGTSNVFTIFAWDSFHF